MKKTLCAVITILSLLTAGAAAIAGDPSAGRTKAGACGACHGPQGVSMNPAWPDLAGQKQIYLVKQLTAFKNGTRKDPLMSPQAAQLSTTDIEDIAAYFAGLPCSP